MKFNWPYILEIFTFQKANAKKLKIDYFWKKQVLTVKYNFEEEIDDIKKAELTHEIFVCLKAFTYYYGPSIKSIYFLLVTNELSFLHIKSDYDAQAEYLFKNLNLLNFSEWFFKASFSISPNSGSIESIDHWVVGLEIYFDDLEKQLYLTHHGFNLINAA